MSSEVARQLLQDIIDNVDAIELYTDGMDGPAFDADRKTQDAVERCLSRITEAVIQLGESESARLGLDVPWRAVRSLGNRLRHAYRQIETSLIFGTVRQDLPPLRAAAVRALSDHG